MTAETLELKKKLDENISQFREKELQKMYEFSQFLLFTLSSSVAKENEPANKKDFAESKIQVLEPQEFLDSFYGE